MHRACDVAEEVARIYGYNRIPSTIPKLSSQGKRTPEQIFEDKVISLALALGFYEVMTYSFQRKAYNESSSGAVRRR